MKIRPAKDGDYAAIACLHRQTIRHVNSKDYPEDAIKVWSARSKASRFRGNADKCRRWVALVNGKIVGFCDHGLNGEFWGLYVHKDHMGRGIGTRLLKIAEKSLKKAGFRKTSLVATITAKRFYEKHGYKVVKKTLHPIGNKKLVVFVMTKKQ